MFSEEILLEIHLTILGARNVVQVESSDIEHLAGTFCIRTCDERGVQIEETLVVEEFMDSESHGVTETQHAAKVIGTGTQVSDSAQELHGVTLFLQRIHFGVGSAIHLDGVSLNFHRLSLTLRFHQSTCHTKAGTRGNLFHQGFVKFGRVGHHLDIAHDRAVVDGDKGHAVVATLGSHPAFHTHFVSQTRFLGTFEQIDYFGSLHSYIIFLILNQLS